MYLVEHAIGPRTIVAHEYFGNFPQLIMHIAGD